MSLIHVASELRECRLERGLRRADLARQAGITVTAVEMLEDPDRIRTVPIADYYRVLAALQMDPEWIATLTNFRDGSKDLFDYSVALLEKLRNQPAKFYRMWGYLECMHDMLQREKIAQLDGDTY